MHTASLRSQLAELESHLSHSEGLALPVSKAPVSWHIDHCCQAIGKIVQALGASNPNEYAPRFSLPKLLIMTTGRIPRGKARAPKEVSATGPVSPAELQEGLHRAKAAIQKLEALPPGHWFPHPYFGHLRTASTLRFLRIHTGHHLRIIRDIVRSAANT